MIPEAGVPKDRTLVEVIGDLRERGFEGDLWPSEDGGLRCGTCHTTTPAGDVRVTEVRRVEGASDPGDEAIVLGLTCPACGVQGVTSLRYGPEAGPEDSAVLQAIDLGGR